MRSPIFASLLPGSFFRQLDRLTRHVRFRVIALFRERLDHMAIAVARRKIHITVNVGRIASQGLLDLTQSLDKLLPIDCAQ